MSSRFETQKSRCEAAGQAHVLQWFEELDPSGQEQLLGQLEEVDFELMARLARMFDAPASEGAAPEFAPPELFPLERGREHETHAQAAHQRGEELLRAGKLAYLIVAGGQASRLGYDGPKGDFPIGPVSGRTLFDFHARRLLAAKKRHDVATHWYVMTSPANDAVTREIFAQAGHFGLPAEEVHFFSQAMMPALDTSGKLLMAARDSLFLAPDGHGGSLAAFQRSGCLAHAKSCGIEQISYFQVDNPLARPADPLFLGLHALAGAGMSTKVVSKRNEGEKVGVLGLVDGKLGCIEYSDLPEDLRGARGADGQLLYRAGNIAVHAISLAFLEEVTSGRLELPWHLARKSMKVLDETGAQVSSSGGKFETFVFDALGLSPASITLEVERGKEFSPVKNAEGEDSPATTQRDLDSLFRGWALELGLSVPEPPGMVEVDPVLAEDLDEFRAAQPLEAEVHEKGHLYR